MKSSPIKLKQKLSSKASAAKKKRDIEYAKSPARKRKKAENQRIGQRSDSDLHHKSDGSVVRMSTKNNIINLESLCCPPSLPHFFPTKLVFIWPSPLSFDPFRVLRTVKSNYTSVSTSTDEVHSRVDI